MRITYRVARAVAQGGPGAANAVQHQKQALLLQPDAPAGGPRPDTPLPELRACRSQTPKHVLRTKQQKLALSNRFREYLLLRQF